MPYIPKKKLPIDKLMDQPLKKLPDQRPDVIIFDDYETDEKFMDVDEFMKNLNDKK